MKNFISNFCKGMLLSAFITMSFISCEDKFDVYEPDASQVVDVILGETAPPVLVVDPWETEVVIPIATNLNHENIALLDNKLSHRIERGVDKHYLVLSLKNKNDKRAFFERIHIPGRGNTPKGEPNLYVVCRTSGEISDLLPYSYLERIGMTFLITDGLFSEPKTKIMDIARLHKDTCLVLDERNLTLGTEISGSRFEKTVEEISESFSFSGQKNSKSKSLLIGASFEQSYSQEEISSDKYEYQVDIYTKHFLSAHLTPQFSADSADAIEFLPYMTDEAIKLLCDSSSTRYKNYKNDKNGIYQLYKDYGTHVTIGGKFGGIYMYVFGRKQMASFRSIEAAAGMSLSAKSVSQDTTPTSNWAQVFIKTMSQTGASISMEGEYYSSDEVETSDARSFFIISGGSGSIDFEAWDKSLANKDSNLSLISYGDESTSYTIPLYYLALDSARRSSMAEYLDTFIEENTVAMHPVPLVVADFRMETQSSEHKIPEYQFMIGPDQQNKLLYYPLIINDKFYDEDYHGRAVDTADDAFLVVAESRAQSWWVALEYADECTPITDIRFLTESEAKENDTTKSYTKRGENAQTGMHWDAIDNHYVYVKFNKYNVTDTANYIKGVGLYHNTEKKNKPAEVPPAVIASSPGTESFAPYVDQTNYNRYWTGDNYVVKGDGEGDSWFGNNNATHHIWRLYPAYTTKNLSRPIEVKKPIPY